MPPPISQASFFLYRALGLLTFFLDTQLGGRCAALGGVTQQRCSFSTVDFLAYKNPGGGLETPNQSWSGGKEIGMSEWYPRPRCFNNQDVLIESTMGTHGGVVTHIAPCFMVSGSKGNRFFEDRAIDHSISGTHFAEGQTFWAITTCFPLHDQTSFLKLVVLKSPKKSTGGKQNRVNRLPFVEAFPMILGWTENTFPNNS